MSFISVNFIKKINKTENIVVKFNETNVQPQNLMVTLILIAMLEDHFYFKKNQITSNLINMPFILGLNTHLTNRTYHFYHNKNSQLGILP